MSLTATFSNKRDFKTVIMHYFTSLFGTDHFVLLPTANDYFRFYWKYTRISKSANKKDSLCTFRYPKN